MASGGSQQLTGGANNAPLPPPTSADTRKNKVVVGELAPSSRPAAPSCPRLGFGLGLVVVEPQPGILGQVRGFRPVWYGDELGGEGILEGKSNSYCVAPMAQSVVKLKIACR